LIESGKFDSAAPPKMCFEIQPKVKAANSIYKKSKNSAVKKLLAPKISSATKRSTRSSKLNKEFMR
jgi:hypothetical protein